MLPASDDVSSTSEEGSVVDGQTRIDVTATHKSTRVGDMLTCSTSTALCLHAETRLVILLDVRRAALLWSPQPHAALNAILASLGRAPTDVATAPGALASHVTVMIGSREGWPLRVLVQGYYQRCSSSVEPLRTLVHEQLRLALDDIAPAVPAPTTSRGLHSCVRDALFCLSLLPARAAPTLAIVTDAVGSPLDAPLLGAVLLLSVAEASSAGASTSVASTSASSPASSSAALPADWRPAGGR